MCRNTTETVDVKKSLNVSDEFLEMFHVLLPLALTPVPSYLTAVVKLQFHNLFSTP